MPVRNLKDGTITVSDADSATGTNKVEVSVEEGNLRYAVAQPAEPVRDRGALSEWGEAQEEPVELSFSAYFQEWAGDGSVTLADALQQQGTAASWTSDSGSRIYTTIITFDIANPDTSAKTDKLVFTQFRAERLEFQEGLPANVINVSGRALMVRPTATRVSQT